MKIISDPLVVPSTTPPLPALAATINELHEQAQAHAQKALARAFECGEALNQAKSQVKHGEWQDWLQANTIISARAARGYMRVASNRLQIEKNGSVADLSLRGAFELLSKPRPRHRIYEVASDIERDRLDVMVSSRMNCPDDIECEALLDYFADCADLAVRYMDWTYEASLNRKDGGDGMFSSEPITALAKDSWFRSALPAWWKYQYSPNKMTSNGIFMLMGQTMIVRIFAIADGWFPMEQEGEA